MPPAKALALFSGGLDSILAVCLAREAGASVTGINFTTPFFGPEEARAAAGRIGLELIVVDIFEEHLEMLKNPRFGYGKNLNPCLDCHLLMTVKAHSEMSHRGYDFLITGDVLGERPKSQNKNSLLTVSKQSGCGELLVRPLSAALLPPTIPEQKGWIDREKLLDITGRSRKRQLELADHFGIKEYPNPAGGCLLTDPGFSSRLRRVLHDQPLTRNRIELLKFGRHFLIKGIHVIVSRNARENREIDSLAMEQDTRIFLDNAPSPLTVVLNGASAPEDVLQSAAALTLRYSKFRDETDVALKIGEQRVIINKALYEHDLERL